MSEEEYNEHIAKVIKDMGSHLEKVWGITPEQINVRNTKDGLVIDFAEMKDVSLECFSGIQSEITNVIRTYTKDSARNEKALAHDKINKHAMHLLRLLMMGTELLTTGEIHTYREKEHDLLMQVRNGEFEIEKGTLSEDFWNILNEWETKFNEAQAHSVLPDKPDWETIDNLKYTVNRNIVLIRSDWFENLCD